MAPRVKVGSHEKNKTHDLSLYDGVRTFGFRLDGGPEAFDEDSATASTLGLGGGQGEFGDGDPHFRNIEQTSWRDGAGQERHNSLAEGFSDSLGAFTMKEKVLFPMPQWKMANGHKSKHSVLPGNMGWFALHSGNKRYISDTFTPSVNITADKDYIWLKKVGTPATLTLSICSNSGGSPSTVLKSATLAATAVTDVLSLFKAFDWTSTEALGSGTVYHVKLSAASTDNESSHWEIGVNAAGATGKTSTDDSAWSAGTFSIYHHVVPADVKCFFWEFELLGGRYAVQVYDNKGTSAKLWLQGIRGEATHVTSTTTRDTAISMTADEYIGCTLLIVDGPGLGEWRTITDNDTDTFTHAAFDTTLTTASNFVVLGSTKWTEVGSTGLALVTGRPVVLNDVAYFPQGNSDNIRRMRWDTTSKAHEFADDSTNKAELLIAHPHRVDGPQVWRAQNKDSGDTKVSRATYKDWGTDLTFGTAITVGAIDGEILDMAVYDSVLWIFRNDNPYTVDNDKAAPQLAQMKFIPSLTNGKGATAHDVMLFIPWAGFTLQKFYGGSLTDITRKRMPAGRGGHYSAGVSHPAGMFWAIDAGTSGTSSVQFYNDERLGWHEVFRAWETGRRIRNIWWEHNPGMRPKLWINVGDELIYQEWPKDTLDPLRDSGMNYQHEFAVEQAAIDGGAISLPKYIEEVKIVSKNLSNSIGVVVDYRTDNDIDVDDDSKWRPLEEYYISPEQEQKVELGDLRLFQTRIRGVTNDSDTPPIVYGVAVKGATRTPFKRRWVARVTVSDTQRSYRGQKDFKTIDVINWLLDVQSRMQQLNMRTGWADADNISVWLDTYKLRREWLRRDGKRGDVISLVLREAE